MSGFTHDAPSLRPGDRVLVIVLRPRSGVLFGDPPRLVGCWNGRLVGSGRGVNRRTDVAVAILDDVLLAQDPDLAMRDANGKEPRGRYLVADPRRMANAHLRAYRRLTRVRVTWLMR